jgi:hypothetical protein
MDDSDPTGATGSTGAIGGTGSAGVLPAHPARLALAVVDRGVAGLAGANLWSMPEQELLSVRVDAEATRGRLDAAVLTLTREIDGRGAAVRAGASSTAAWLRGCCRQRPAIAHGEVRLAAELDTDLPTLAAALAAGQVSHESARVVADTIRALPAAVDPATRARGEAFLVDQARRYDAAAVATLGKHLLDRLDPTRGGDLEREEALREEAEAFTVTHDLHGGRRVTGPLTPAHGATLDAALEVLAAPQRGPDGEPDPRTAEKRRADALMLLASWGLASENMPTTGGEAVTMTVITTPGHLQTITGDNDSGDSAEGDRLDFRSRWLDSEPPQPQTPPTPSPGDPLIDDSATDHTADDAATDDDGADAHTPDASAVATVGEAAGLPPREDAAFLEDGTPLSPETTRRLGCDAWLVAAIIDSAGALLDIGRKSRIVPAAMRRALIVRDGGCAFPGCGRPPAWCHAHHIVHWAHGGPTALHNLVLLCTHHHSTVHHDSWTVHLDTRGLPIFTPPRWIDPDQVPRPAWRPITVLRT